MSAWLSGFAGPSLVLLPAFSAQEFDARQNSSKLLMGTAVQNLKRRLQKMVLWEAMGNAEVTSAFTPSYKNPHGIIPEGFGMEGP